MAGGDRGVRRSPPRGSRADSRGAFPAGRELCFDFDGVRLNLRVAAIALRDRHVLVHRLTTDPFWTLPGGRVRLGETFADALARELREELGVSVRPGGLRFVVESFFEYSGRPFHEIGHYHSVDLPAAFPFRRDGRICHRSRDGGGSLEFAWLRAIPSALAAVDFRPVALRDRLAEPRAALEHLVLDELGGE